MFYGEYGHSIDRKGRLVFPSKFREVSKENYIERFYITRGLDKCLFVFTEEEWKLQEQKFKSLSFTKAEARKFNRLYFSGACEIILDRQGRILIPKYLKDYAEIIKEVVIVGVANRIEIWSKKHWRDFYEKTQGAFEDIAEKTLIRGKMQNRKVFYLPNGAIVESIVPSHDFCMGCTKLRVGCDGNLFGCLFRSDLGMHLKEALKQNYSVSMIAIFHIFAT